MVERGGARDGVETLGAIEEPDEASQRLGLMKL